MAKCASSQPYTEGYTRFVCHQYVIYVYGYIPSSELVDIYIRCSLQGPRILTSRKNPIPALPFHNILDHLLDIDTR